MDYTQTGSTTVNQDFLQKLDETEKECKFLDQCFVFWEETIFNPIYVCMDSIQGGSRKFNTSQTMAKPCPGKVKSNRYHS